jgi:hypothetical protein
MIQMALHLFGAGAVIFIIAGVVTLACTDEGPLGLGLMVIAAACSVIMLCLASVPA